VRTRAIFAALLASLVVVLSACGGGGASNATAGQGFVAGDGSIVLLDPDQRVAAPDFTGTTLTDESFALAEHRGEVIAINVWASWCGPCRAEAPALEAVWTQNRANGFLMLGLDTRDSLAAAQGFVRNYAITFPSVVDTDGQIQLLFAGSLPPQAIPSTVIVDKQGRVAARVLGPTSQATLQGLIDSLLAEPS
jgi:thiol-disulfide isomerase/thioredoxin